MIKNKGATRFEARRKLDVCERNQDIYEPLLVKS
jgi:hypothetical protein